MRTLFLLPCVLFSCLSWCDLASAQNHELDRLDVIEDAFSSRTLFRENRSAENPQARGGETGFDFLRFRTYDGSMNNLSNTHWGHAGSKLWRVCPEAYEDGASAPARANNMSARGLSNIFSHQESVIHNSRQMTDMVWQWGQFLDHDIDLTESKTPPEPMPIVVPMGDPFFDPFGTGTVTISFFRSTYLPRTGVVNAREQKNGITAWIDGSNVYGSSEEKANQLRLFSGGELLCTDGFGGQFLPRDEDGFFLSGDVRVNEQIALTCMHTLFMREHNRIARQFQIRFPRLDDEAIFQLARKRVIAHLQAITFNEFLPALMGPEYIAPYQGYDASTFPGITNIFSTVAYRFGHSMLGDNLLRLSNSGFPIRRGNISLADAFFNPELLSGIGIDPYLKGLVTQQAQEVDLQLVNSIRNFLFGPPGAGGFDLAALNIQRGRDHGLPDYNTMRITFGLPPVSSYSEITSDEVVQDKLEQVFGSVDAIDPWVGILAEDHLADSSLGITAATILKEQFERVRDGDRFWYQLEFSGRLLQEIETTKLSDIILRNTGVGNIPVDVFTSQ